MIVQLKQLFDVVGDKRSFQYEIPLDDLKIYVNYPFTSPILIKADFENRVGIVSLNLSGTFSLKHNCDRCLCEFNKEFSYDFKHILVRSLNSNSDDYLVCPENKLDLNELAISNLLLQLPSKLLCKEDCQGLCVICGNDNNISSCNCIKE